MGPTDRVVKHLEFIQGIINRLGGNAFLLKGWSMTVLVAGSLLMVRIRPDKPLLALTLLIPVLGFWLLDAYFLWQERLFRAEYDRVRQQNDTDFEMNPIQHKDKHTGPAAFISITLGIFYLTEVFFILVFGILLCFIQSLTPGVCFPEFYFPL